VYSFIMKNPYLTRLSITKNLHGGTALDLGANNALVATFLKEQNYAVTVVDKNITNFTDEDKANFTVVESSLTDFTYNENFYDLVLAGNVLPFLKDEDVFVYIEKIVSSLKNDGFFCFSLFGKEDAWSTKENMSFQTYEEALDFIATLPVEIFFQQTEKGIGTTMKGDNKFWEIHRFILKKK